MFASLIPGFKTMLGGPYGGYDGVQWLSFAIFWGINILVVYKGMDLLKKIEGFAAPFVLVMTLCLVFSALPRHMDWATCSIKKPNSTAPASLSKYLSHLLQP